MSGLSSMLKRATTAQKELLLQLLAKRDLIMRTRISGDRTGPMWRALFRAIGMPEPTDVFGWPTVDKWIGELTITEASAAIRHLQQQGEASR
jgi:hypothetical protein